MGRNKNRLAVRELTPAELNEKFRLLQGFSDIWSHLKFPVTGKLNVATLQELLTEATELSLILRAHLQKNKNGGKFIRIVPGSVREYIHNLESFPEDQRNFIREVIHACFSNQSGYVLKISREEMDSLISSLLKSQNVKNQTSAEETMKLEGEVKAVWSETNKTVQEIFSAFESKQFANPEYVKSLEKILHNIRFLNQQVVRFHQKITVEMKQEDSESMSEASEDANSEAEKEPEDESEPKVSDMMPEESLKIGSDALEPPKPEKKEDAPVQTAAALRRVASDVGHIQEGLLTLSHDIQSLQAKETPNIDEKAKVVTELHKRCVGFSEGLMKDLYTLDELSLGEEDRHQRKEQVKRIQSMTNDVDSLMEKLHSLIESFKSQKASAPVAAPSAPAPAAASPSPSAEPVGAEKKSEVSMDIEAQKGSKEEEMEAEPEEPFFHKKAKTEMDFQQNQDFENRLIDQSIRLEAYWRRMKLSPKLHVEEASDGYLISGYIPGMKKEDIFISTHLEGRTPVLSVRGHRSPSIQEIALMRRQLARAGFDPNDEAILRLGMGRFGTFLEKFAIPNDVNPDKISGGYESGELKVILPKVQIARVPRVRPFLDPEQLWW